MAAFHSSRSRRRAPAKSPFGKAKSPFSSDTPFPNSLPIGEQIQFLRTRLFNAMAIVDVCGIAASSLATDDPERLEDALRAAYELIDDVAGALELVAKQANGQR